MSKLKGHRRITEQAVKELVRELPNDPLFASLARANVPSHAVARDIYDVLSMGHWFNFGQKHHFMRRYDGQKPFEAYQENVTWIMSNALSAAKKLHERISLKFGSVKGAGSPRPTGPGPLTPEQRLAGRLVFDGGDGDGVSWQSLGNACHALQDSFAGGHVVRLFPRGKSHPGEIADILIYADNDEYKEEHDKLDHDWHVKGSDEFFSSLGWLAVGGTKALIRMTIDSAARAGTEPPRVLSGWSEFQRTWLAISPDLMRLDPDAAIRFVRRFATGTFSGAKVIGHITVNMDEDGLADALVREYGTDTRRVHAVFDVLGTYHYTDSDDVAEAYTDLVRKRGGDVAAAVRNDQALVTKLVELLEEGWTSGGENDAIKWLSKV